MSIYQIPHFGLLVGTSVIWRQRRASEAGMTLMGIYHGRHLSSLHCLCLATLEEKTVLEDSSHDPCSSLSFPPLPFDPRCLPNSPSTFGELVYPQPGSNPCSSSMIGFFKPSAQATCFHSLLEWLQEQRSHLGGPAAPLPDRHCLSPWWILCPECPACGMSHRLEIRPQADEVGMRGVSPTEAFADLTP